MKSQSLVILLAGTLLLLSACQDESPRPWVPVLGQVDYVALHDAVREAQRHADRVYFLNRKEGAQEKLRGAAALLEKVGAAGGKRVEEAVGEVLVMIDDLERSIDSEPQQVAEKMRALGEKVNLMLLKGELILAGVTYVPGT